MNRPAGIAKLWLDARSRDPAMHMRVLVRTVFLYSIYRIISRPAIQYGLLTSEDATWPRSFTSFYPVELSQLFGFPVLFDFWWPTPELIAYVQIGGVGAAILGTAGVMPRLMATVLFLSLSFTTWMMQITNAEVDGGTLVLALLMWFATSPAGSLGFGKRECSLPKPNRDLTWRSQAGVGLVGSQIIVGSFYLLSGINKLVDVGIDFPFRLSLDNLARGREYETVSMAARLGYPPLLAIIEDSQLFSIFAGFVVLFVELFFIFSLLLFRKPRVFFVAGLTGLHTMVFFTAGINFLGNTLILLAVLDVSRGPLTLSGARRVIAKSATKLSKRAP